MWRYFTDKKTKRWVDVLPQMTKNYNSTFHRSIKMSPNSVTWDNRKTVYKQLYPDINVRIKCKLKVGDTVRIALKKDIFEKVTLRIGQKRYIQSTKFFKGTKSVGID